MILALAQMNSTFGDLRATVARMVEQTKLAKERGADLTIFPLPVLTGYDLGDLASSEPFLRDIAASIETFCQQAETPALVPFLAPLGGSSTVEVAYIHEGEFVPLRMTSYLRSMVSQGVFLGEDPKVSFTLGDIEVAVCTHYEALETYASGSGDADVVVYLPHESFSTDDEASVLAPAVADGAFVRTATEGNCWLVAVGGVGAQESAVYTGGSFVLTPWGELACVAPSFEEALITVEVNPLFEGPLKERIEPPSYDRKRFVWGALTLALRDFVTKQGYSGVALGLCGDVSTSALAVLAVDALGPTKVRALGVAEGDEERKDVARLAKNLHIAYQELSQEDLQRCCDCLQLKPEQCSSAILGAWLLGQGQNTTEGILSLTAVDKTALASGQDKDGFGSAAYAPFKDVYRSDLAALLPERNLQSPVIPRGVLKRLNVPQGVGLDDLASTPESQLSTLDAAFLARIEHGFDGRAMVEHGISEKLTLVVSRLLDETGLLRKRCPLGPLVSDCSLEEWDYPIPCAWHETPERLEHEESQSDDEAAPLSFGEREQQGTASFTMALPQDMLENLPDDILKYLKDVIQGGGLNYNGDDVWAQGLFSKN